MSKKHQQNTSLNSDVDVAKREQGAAMAPGQQSFSVQARKLTEKKVHTSRVAPTNTQKVGKNYDLAAGEQVTPFETSFQNNNNNMTVNREGEIDDFDVRSKPSSGQFRIIRSVRADAPMLNQESSYGQISNQASQEDLNVALDADLETKYKNTNKN